MTVAIVKTKAEQALGQQFEAMADALPGTGWVRDLRREAIGAFETLGLPGRRVEAFKYTDLKQKIGQVYPVAANVAGDVPCEALNAALGSLAELEADRLVLVNGTYRADLSVRDGLKDCAEFISLGPLLEKAPDWFAGKFDPERIGDCDGVTALNTAFMSDGVLLKIKPGETATRPVLLVHVRSGSEPVSSYSRNMIAIEAGSSATLLEVFVSVDGAAAGQGNSFADVAVAEGGRLEHLVCRLGDGAEQDVAHTTVNVEGNAQYKMFHLIAGAGLARHQASIRMVGKGGDADISGVFLGRGKDHIDITLVIDHIVPGCKSRELFKGVLAGEARGVFQGKVIVRPDAQETDGQMMAHALMLSEDAEFDSKPELEIYADDVQCGHGSTCADLDKDLIFFCLSRGLSESEAKALLIRGFVGEVIDGVGRDDVRGAFEAIASGWLGRGADEDR